MVTVREIKNLTDLESFYNDNADSLHIVKIGAPWCGPCRNLGDILHNMDENKIGNTLIADVNIEEEENEDIASKYSVRSIPVMLFVKNGEVVNKIVGAVNADAIYSKIEEYK